VCGESNNAGRDAGTTTTYDLFAAGDQAGKYLLQLLTGFEQAIIK